MRQKRTANRYHQASTALSYAAVVALIGSLVSVGYQSPVEQKVASRGVTDSSVLSEDAPSVDQILAADLAASAAQTANLAVADNASDLSISLNAKSELSQSDDSVLSKPQIVQLSGERRGLTDYTVVAGDNVTSIAKKFGVSEQTLRWANGLTTDAMTPGRVLTIPGTDGVVYTVKQGDTIDTIASRYNVDKQRIVTYNDLELTGVNAGMRIVLPEGVLPDNERPGSVVRSPNASFSTPASGQTFTANAASVGNRYSYGYCTWYAYNRRAELGRPVGSFWGNAVTWAGYARSSGYLVDNNPEVGAVLQSGGYGGLGHVAVVESVGADGSVTVSEMNYAGWNVISTRTIPAGQARAYNYIH